MGLQWVVSREFLKGMEWITSVFRGASVVQCRLFCCFLWCLWTERNKRVHENSIKNSKDILRFITQYMQELDGIGVVQLTRRLRSVVWEPPREA